MDEIVLNEIRQISDSIETVENELANLESRHFLLTAKLESMKKLRAVFLKNVQSA
jgi:hypothetical protein